MKTGITAKPTAEIESSSLDVDVLKKAESARSCPDPAEHQGPHARKVLGAVRDMMEEASINEQSEENEPRDMHLAAEHITSKAALLSKSLKRKAEDNGESAERRRKLDDSTETEQELAVTSDLSETNTAMSAEEEKRLNMDAQNPIVTSNSTVPEVSASKEVPGQMTGSQCTEPEIVVARKDAKLDSKPHARAPSVQNQTPKKPKAGSLIKSKKKGSSSKKPRDDSDEDYEDHKDEDFAESGGDGNDSESVSVAVTKPVKKLKLTTGKASVKSTTPSKKSEVPQPPRNIPLPAEAVRPTEAEPHERQGSPRIAQTQQQANPAEMIVMCDKPFVEKQMTNIERALSNAMLAFFQEEHIDAQAMPKVEPRPEPELTALYEAQWGDRWQSTFFGLAGRKKPVNLLKQKSTFLGLLGTGIKVMVYAKPLPWDMEAKLGSDLTYFEQVVNDLGHGIDSVMKYVKGKQIADPDFMKSHVVPLARKLAGELALALTAHVKQMTRRGKLAKADIVEFDPWITYLEDAFQVAIVLKQTLQSSHLGPFKQDWPQYGESEFEIKWHRPYYERKGVPHADLNILHSVLPGVYKIEAGQRVYFSRALVVAE